MTLTIVDAVATLANNINCNNNNNNNQNLNFKESSNTVVSGNTNVANQINFMMGAGKKRKKREDKRKYSEALKRVF